MSARRRLLVALVSLISVAGIAVQGATPPATRAAQPPTAQCRQPFLAAPPAATSAGASGDCATPTGGASALAAAVPAGFQESVVWSGLTNPTAVRFAADGRVFVAEKSGVIKVFDNLSDTTPTTFSGLTTNVQNFWDRGLLGLALDPSLTGGTGTGSYIYVLYTYDHILGSGGTAPRWGDTCPSPPGATVDGCVVSGRLSRFPVSGSSISGAEQVLIEDWCQQYPSHSIGSLAFGADGSLYLSGGDGASFNGIDYGQLGGTTTPIVTGKNPCGDPPADGMTPPTAEGGALRSQDVRTEPPGVGTYSDVVLADAPLAYYHLNEASDTALLDATGAHNGTYVGSPALAQPGIAGTGVRFDGGPGDYAEVPSWTSQPAAPASIEAWVSHDGVKFAGVDTSIAGFVNAGTRALRLMAFSVDADTLELGIYTENGNAHFNWTPTDQGYHHLVGTIDAAGTTGRLYLDGVQVASNGLGYPGGGPTQAFRIGTGTDAGAAGTQSWPGRIDEVAVYGTALSAAQVAAHYNAGISGSGTASSDPTGLDGAVLRVDPATGAGMPGNPFAGSSNANSRRIIAYGLRNPFRITARPGTNEVWVGDVGWNTWEEINRIPNGTDAVAENFGWPCYEGVGRQSSYDGTNLNLCETLYAQGTGAVAAPTYTYNHSATVITGETCPTGSSSIAGLAFYPETGGSFPASYRGGLFFTDYSRKCIWFIPKGTNGEPDPAARQAFATAVAGPVEVVIGPNGDLFYVDFDTGSIRRITWSGGNQAPTAVIQAVPTSGAAPLTVQFDGSGSFDPEGSALTYAWDLDGDAAFDDATGATASWTYTDPGNVTVRLRVTDNNQLTGTASQVIGVSNTPPVPTIATPTSSLTWKVGDLIAFSGSATDAQDGTLPDSALSWTLTLQHCPSNCHAHTIQTWPGVASGSFNAPDHEYPSYLELTLTATDSLGTTASRTVRLDPQTVVLTFQTAPAGLSLAVNSLSSTTTFTRTVIVGSSNSVTATSPQTSGGLTYTFGSWSDGLAQSHQIVAPATATTYTATYNSTSFSIATSADALIRWNKATSNFGTTSQLQVRSGQYRSYLKFVVSGLSAPPSAAKLRLWVTDASTNGGSCSLVSNSWTETGITWNNAPAAGATISNIGAAAAGTWVECDVVSVISGNGTYSFAIAGGNNDAAIYASRETANDPVLVLTP